MMFVSSSGIKNWEMNIHEYIISDQIIKKDIKKLQN